MHVHFWFSISLHKLENEIRNRFSSFNEKWKMDVHIPFSIFHSHWKMKITVCTRTIFDNKLSFLPHIRQLKNKCTKALNLLRLSAHTTWGADQETLLHLCRSLIRSKLDYGCVVYGSARRSYLRTLDPIQNHALLLCLGAFRTSPATSLCVAANEPPLELRRTRLCLQCVLKLSSKQQNRTHNVVFNKKFKSFFEHKPKQIPLLCILVSCDLKDVGFQKKNVLSSNIVSTPPWHLM